MWTLAEKKSVIKLLGYSFFSPDTEKDVLKQLSNSALRNNIETGIFSPFIVRGKSEGLFLTNVLVNGT